LWCSSWGGRTADAGHECQNKRPSFIRREFEAAAGGGGGAVVAARSKFDAAIHDPLIEPMDGAAIATLLTKVAHVWPRPLAGQRLPVRPMCKGNYHHEIPKR
jgi:hypothetical protein